MVKFFILADLFISSFLIEPLSEEFNVATVLIILLAISAFIDIIAYLLIKDLRQFDEDQKKYEQEQKAKELEREQERERKRKAEEKKKELEMQSKLEKYEQEQKAQALERRRADFAEVTPKIIEAKSKCSKENFPDLDMSLLPYEVFLVDIFNRHNGKIKKFLAEIIAHYAHSVVSDIWHGADTDRIFENYCENFPKATINPIGYRFDGVSYDFIELGYVSPMFARNASESVNKYYERLASLTENAFLYMMYEKGLYTGSLLLDCDSWDEYKEFYFDEKPSTQNKAETKNEITPVSVPIYYPSVVQHRNDNIFLDDIDDLNNRISELEDYIDDLEYQLDDYDYDGGYSRSYDDGFDEGYSAGVNNPWF